MTSPDTTVELFIAYTVVWLIFAAYLYILSREQRKTSRQLEALGGSESRKRYEQGTSG